jgi:hypothetical protein
MAVVTINDYNTPAPASSVSRGFSRQCPNFVSPWAGMASSYDLSISSRSERARRLAFVLIQVLLFAYVFITSGVPTAPFDGLWLFARILFCFFLAWNVHLIVRMTGERVVFGKAFGRTWFDGFLMGCVAAFAFVLGVKLVGGWDVEGAWLVLDLAIFGVAWVSTWKEGGVILG